jgi:hypothetical protein
MFDCALLRCPASATGFFVLNGMYRSTFIVMVTAFAITPAIAVATKKRISVSTLLSVPLELGGDWGESPERAALVVLSRARQVCLSGVRLLSDQQPEKLRVDNHSSGPPHIWLHSDLPGTAWIIVDIGTRDWCKLAYQFGHELGHVLCNSWRWGDNPKPPSQWLEESIAEAFSLRGLALLAASWEQNPPFPDDSAFAEAIRQYRANLLAAYRKTAEIDLADWLHAGQPVPEHPAAAKGPAVAPILDSLEQNERCVEDMGALNRWPERTGLPIKEYLRLWKKSCRIIGAPGLLPMQVRGLLNLR